MTVPTAERLSRVERREQLLESAADLLVEKGFDAVTMEGVAARAGVSKALPYTHFENAGALIAALWERELAILSQKIIEAAASKVGVDAKVTAVVRAYFETLKDRGEVLTTFVRWLPQWQDRVRDQPHAAPTPFERLMWDVFENEVGLSMGAARVVQRLFGTALIGAYDAWTLGFASQAETERMVVRLIVDGSAAIAEEERN